MTLAVMLGRVGWRERCDVASDYWSRWKRIESALLVLIHPFITYMTHRIIFPEISLPERRSMLSANHCSSVVLLVLLVIVLHERDSSTR